MLPGDAPVKLLPNGNVENVLPLPFNDGMVAWFPNACRLNGKDNAAADEAKSVKDTTIINNASNTLILTLLIDFYILTINKVINIIHYFFGAPIKLARMVFKKFVLFSRAGSLPWCYALAYAGIVPGKNWGSLNNTTDTLTLLSS